jgi:hypothetical protein
VAVVSVRAACGGAVDAVGAAAEKGGVDGDVTGLESAHDVLRPAEERRDTVGQELGAEESVDPRPWTSMTSKSQGAGRGRPGGAEGVPPATREGRAREIDGELHGGN